MVSELIMHSSCTGSMNRDLYASDTFDGDLDSDLNMSLTAFRSHLVFAWYGLLEGQ